MAARLKLVVVGDGSCGKTSLLLVYAEGAFPECYAPSVFEKYSTTVQVGSKTVALDLYDTADLASAIQEVGLKNLFSRTEQCRRMALDLLESKCRGQEDYDRLRPLSYQNANVVLICYDVMSPTSYDNVLIKWYPEVSHFCRGVPLVLIGCKTDLRKDKEHLRKLRSSQQEPITYTQGEATCRQMNAEVYLECSAKFRENVEDVFKEATTIALNAIKKAKRQKKHKRCSIL